MFRAFVLLAALSTFSAGHLWGNIIPALYSFGPDNQSIPSEFSGVSGALTDLFHLGDDSFAFNGGLTTSNGLFYAITNDGLGNSTLQSFSLAGAGSLQGLFSLGAGFIGGLAFNSADGFFYAIGNDFLGNSTLYRISLGNNSVTPLGTSFGAGFNSGLAFDGQNSTFYAISGDNNGVPRFVNSIALNGNGTPAVASLFSLGDGSTALNGGMVTVSNLPFFYVIGSDLLGDSSLYTFNLSGANSLVIINPDFGTGFANAGLVLAPAVAVPEPSTFALLFVGAVYWGIRLLTIRAATQRHE
jgi:hypothetical protein